MAGLTRRELLQDVAFGGIFLSMPFAEAIGHDEYPTPFEAMLEEYRQRFPETGIAEVGVGRHYALIGGAPRKLITAGFPFASIIADPHRAGADAVAAGDWSLLTCLSDPPVDPCLGERLLYSNFIPLAERYIGAISDIGVSEGRDPQDPSSAFPLYVLGKRTLPDSELHLQKWDVPRMLNPKLGGELVADVIINDVAPYGQEKGKIVQTPDTITIVYKGKGRDGIFMDTFDPENLETREKRKLPELGENLSVIKAGYIGDGNICVIAKEYNTEDKQTMAVIIDPGGNIVDVVGDIGNAYWNTTYTIDPLTKRLLVVNPPPSPDLKEDEVLKASVMVYRVYGSKVHKETDFDVPPNIIGAELAVIGRGGWYAIPVGYPPSFSADRTRLFIIYVDPINGFHSIGLAHNEGAALENPYIVSAVMPCGGHGAVLVSDEGGRIIRISDVSLEADGGTKTLKPNIVYLPNVQKP